MNQHRSQPTINGDFNDRTDRPGLTTNPAGRRKTWRRALTSRCRARARTLSSPARKAKQKIRFPAALQPNSCAAVLCAPLQEFLVSDTRPQRECRRRRRRFFVQRPRRARSSVFILSIFFHVVLPVGLFRRELVGAWRATALHSQMWDPDANHHTGTDFFFDWDWNWRRPRRFTNTTRRKQHKIIEMLATTGGTWCSSIDWVLL